MTEKVNKILTFTFVSLTVLNLALASYFFAKKPKGEFVESYGDRAGSWIENGYLVENADKTGAIAVGKLVAVWEEDNKVVGRFEFGKGVKMAFVLGVFKPEVKLHFWLAKSRELFPTSDKTQVKPVEPQAIKRTLLPYRGRQFRLGLKKPYDETKLQSKGTKPEILALIKAINPFYACNAKLIAQNPQGKISQPVNCLGAVFNLLTYEK